MARRYALMVTLVPTVSHTHRMLVSQLPAVHGTCVLTLSSHALELLWAQTTIPLASGKSAEPVRWDSEMVHPGPKKGDNGVSLER